MLSFACCLVAAQGSKLRVCQIGICSFSIATVTQTHELRARVNAGGGHVSRRRGGGSNLLSGAGGSCAAGLTGRALRSAFPDALRHQVAP
jgi:hypothetical protein